MIDFSVLTMTDIIRLQNQLQQELVRRFEREMLLVFSDIVGSTPYFGRFGDTAGRQLQQLHSDLLGKPLAATGGRIVDTAGDGGFLAFAAAESAVQWLIEFQRLMAIENASRGSAHQLQVRIGMHWGSVLTDGQAVSGDAVNICARVAASADPGETRLTRGVFRELGRTYRLQCRALAQVSLKGLDAPVDLFALDWRDESQFPRRLLIVETGEQIALPRQDIVTFGRWAEHDGVRANDIVLNHPNADFARQISRWHFELRRHADGLYVHALSDSATEVDDALVDKGSDVPVRAGSRIRVGRALTLLLIGERRLSDDDGDVTMMQRPAVEGDGTIV